MHPESVIVNPTIYHRGRSDLVSHNVVNISLTTSSSSGADQFWETN